MRKFFIMVILCLLMISILSSQSWERTYHSSIGGWEFGKKVFETDDSGYFIVGGIDFLRLFLIRTEPLGDTLWTRVYFDFEPCSAIRTNDDCFVVVGGTSFGTGYISGAVMAKINSSGDIIWSRTYGEDAVCGYSIDAVFDGGFIVTGIARVSSSSLYDIYVLRTDSLGEPLWERTFGDSAYNESGVSVICTADSHFAIVSRKAIGDMPSDNIYLMKISRDGGLLWLKTYGGPDVDVGSSIVRTDDGGFAIAGYTGEFMFSIVWPDFCLIRTDSTGELLWEKIYETESLEKTASVILTSNGEFIICGCSRVNPGPSACYNAYLVCLDSLGDTLWTKLFEHDGRMSEFFDVIETCDGDIVAVGRINDISPYDTIGVYLTKIDVWNKVKNNEKDKIVSYISVSPSPFNSSCVISAPAGAEIEISDISGRKVWENLCSRESVDLSPLSSGTEPQVQEVVWTPEPSVRSGIYFVRAIMKNGQTMIKKVVLVR